METNASLDGDNSLCVIFIIGKKIEDKISTKEELVESLQARLKSEQKELEVLYSEKEIGRLRFSQ